MIVIEADINGLPLRPKKLGELPEFTNLKSKECVWCEEEVKPDENAITLPHIEQGNGISFEVLHFNCFMRTIVGSVGHQMHLCGCYGGHQDDPIGVSRREAANQAVNLWNQRPGRN